MASLIVTQNKPAIVSSIWDILATRCCFSVWGLEVHWETNKKRKTQSWIENVSSSFLTLVSSYFDWCTLHAGLYHSALYLNWIGWIMVNQFVKNECHFHLSVGRPPADRHQCGRNTWYMQHVAFVTHTDLKVGAGSISLCHISFSEASQSLMACDK